MIRPTPDAILRAQDCLLEWLDVPLDEAPGCCWACRAQGAPLERAHIIADYLGGSVHPSNFFLLCGSCHAEQPCAPSVILQLLWIRYHESEIERVTRLMQPYMAAVADGLISQERVTSLFEVLGEFPR